MANMITRTIYETVVRCARVVVKEGKADTIELEPLTIIDTKKPTEKAINKEVRKAYPYCQPIILKTESSETLIGMELEIFVENAKPVKRPASQKRGEK